MKTVLLSCLAVALAMTASAQSEEYANDLSAAVPFKPNTDYGFSSARPATLAARRAEFPGGTEALQQYLATGFVYPPKAVENGVEGTVKVRFTIDRTGKAMDPEIVQSVHRMIDKEVVRLIRNMPDWAPGIENGVAIETTIEIPVEFALR